MIMRHEIKIMNMSKPVQSLTLKQTNKQTKGGGVTSSECLQANKFFSLSTDTGLAPKSANYNQILGAYFGV